MEKQKLEGFINRYNLGGEVESVMIKSDGEKLNVNMISDDKSLLGDVSVSDIKFPEGEFGIYTTSQLKGLLSVLDESIKVDKTENSLKFSDKGTKVQYMLAAPTVIPSVPELKKLPEFDVQITMDNDFISKYIKSKGALTDAETFTFVYKKGKGEIVLGYSSINSNRISLTVDCKCASEEVEPISFSANFLKSILVANRNSKSSSMEISSEGLARLQFENDDYKSTYYLVQVK